MKKIIAIIIVLTVILSGCSSKTNNADKTEAPASNSTQQTKQANESKNTDSSIDSNDFNNIDTDKSPFEKGYYDYQGTIGKNMYVQMSIYPLEKDIAGSYFYESQRKEIKLKGKAGEKEIILYEYDETGKNTGLFKGSMDTVDKIEGTWINTDNNISYPFTLALKSILPGVEYGKRYASAASSMSDQEVESFVSKIQSYVSSDNKKQLADIIAYPVKVKIKSKVVTIKNKDEFINNYNEIFHPGYKQVIINAFNKYMFANWRGIMFGTGSNNIWINEIKINDNLKLMITSINN